MKSNFNIIKSIYGWVLDAILPERCLKCGSGNKILCPDCIGQIKHAKMHIKDDVYACFDYHDPLIKKIIWNLKYYNHFSLGDTIGGLMYEILYKEIEEAKKYTPDSAIYVIPVPLSKSRRKKRGYNQAEMIARGFCMSEKDAFELRNDIVIKKLDTIQQARVSERTKRLRNLKGAFEIPNPSLLKGKTVIVIDDVITTGGTIEEIMKTIKKSGAKRVIAFAVAH